MKKMKIKLLGDEEKNVIARSRFSLYDLVEIFRLPFATKKTLAKVLDWPELGDALAIPQIALTADGRGSHWAAKRRAQEAAERGFPSPAERKKPRY